MASVARPSSQEIKDKDVAVHNYLLDLAQISGPKTEAQILAAGLAAIHERLGDMFIWIRGMS